MRARGEIRFGNSVWRLFYPISKSNCLSEPVDNLKLIQLKIQYLYELSIESQTWTGLKSVYASLVSVTHKFIFFLYMCVQCGTFSINGLEHGFLFIAYLSISMDTQECDGSGVKRHCACLQPRFETRALRDRLSSRSLLHLLPT